MINLDSITNENNKEQNKKWPYTPSVQNLNNRWLWIMKNKRIASFGKGTR